MSFILIFLNKFLIIFVLFTITIINIDCCHYNRKITKLIPVTRTRLRRNENIFKKLNPFKKSTIEMYTEMEFKIESISECCSGYEMNFENRCIPLCPLGCPKFSTCVLPSKCQCNDGFLGKNSTKNNELIKICEPDCSLGPCPDYSKCIAPNQCECVNGYKRQGFKCISNCLINCNNGECDDDNKCNCYPGYVLNSNGFCIDENIKDGEGDDGKEKDKDKVEEKEDKENELTTTDMSTILTTNENDSSDYTDYNELITISTITFNIENPIEMNFNCSDGFIQFNGDCRPVIDDTFENFICNEKCKLNFICSSNGKCICKSGYELSKNDECLLNSNKLTNEISFDFEYWLIIFLIIILSLSFLGIIIKIGGHFVIQKGHFEVKDKHYEYDVEYKKGNKKQCAV